MNSAALSEFEKEIAVLSAEKTKSQFPLVEFLSPKQIRDYRPPPGMILIGQNHIVRGAVFVIGGAPGVGKSRASVALAVAGATCQPWFGLSVHQPFKTLIIQNENGRIRLSDEFFALDCDSLENFIRITPPPPCGLALRNIDFFNAISEQIDLFKPDLILIDPWNAVAQDDKARDYLDTFDLIRRLVPANDSAPAIGIIAHTRKPKHDERASGRSLLNLLAGSYVLGSVPRSAFVLQPASDAPEDSRVVFTCCKNNDGQMGEQTAWIRRNGLFEAVPDFDWDEFRGGSDTNRVSITAEDVADVFQRGALTLTKQDAVKALIEATGCKPSAAYNAFKTNGRFSKQLSTAQNGSLKWIGDSGQFTKSQDV